MDEKLNVLEPTDGTPAQQDDIMGNIQDMVGNLLKNAVEKMQKSETAPKIGVIEEDQQDEAQPQFDISEVKHILSTLQKFIDSVNVMLAQLEGGVTDYDSDADKFMDDYMATADNILEIAAFSTKDNVTGLSNRYGFDNRLILEWNRAIREKSSLSILIFSLDGFHHSDGSRDHHQRDSILKEIAKVLEVTIKRFTDFTSRWSDDEFAILLPITDEKGAMIVAERICAEFENSNIMSSDGSGVKTTVCIGMCVTADERNEQPAEFVNKAHAALVKARKAGNGTIVLD